MEKEPIKDANDLNSPFKEALRSLSILRENDEFSFTDDGSVEDTLGDDEFEGDFEEAEDDLETLVYTLKDTVDRLYDILLGEEEEESELEADIDGGAADDLSNITIPQESKTNLGTPLKGQKVPQSLAGKNNKVPGKLCKKSGSARLIAYQKAKSKLKPIKKGQGLGLAKKGNQKVSCPSDNLFTV